MLSVIRSYLPGHPWREKIQYFDVLNSTNTYAKQLAAEGAAEGTVIIAGHQTGGRGRLGRSFSSPAGMGIYLSVILRPDCRPEELMHLTCAAGVAAADAIGRPDVGIKWTNDLVLGKRKLGGILTELSIDPASGMVAWAVVGIGINCCQQPGDFPEDIRDMAGSLAMIAGQDIDRAKVATAMMEALLKMSEELISEKAAILSRYRLSCVTLHQDVVLVRGDEKRYGHALDIDEAGALIVRFADGATECVNSGEVSVRGMYGYV